MRNYKFFVFLILIILYSTLFAASCFNEKKSPLYNSEWLMQNFDSNNDLYYHQLFLNSDHTVTMQVYYKGSLNAIVWSGKYKLDDKKITFTFDKCVQFENGQPKGIINTIKIIKYFNGVFYYSVGKIDESAFGGLSPHTFGASSPNSTGGQSPKIKITNTTRGQSSNNSNTAGGQSPKITNGGQTPKWHLELIRPQNYFYGENLDFFGNPMETFVKQEN